MNKHDLGDFGKRTAAELGWGSREVTSVAPDVAAIEAMLLMNERQISAVAVVDGIGKIIGNFSVSEMRWAGRQAGGPWPGACASCQQQHRCLCRPTEWLS